MEKINDEDYEINDEDYENTLRYLKSKLNKKLNPNRIYDVEKKIHSNNDLIQIKRRRKSLLQKITQHEEKIETKPDENISSTIKNEKIKPSDENFIQENNDNDKETKIIKSKIFKVVKKEASNIEVFPKKFKKKSMELIKIIEQFNEKVYKSHELLKYTFSNNLNNGNQNLNEKNIFIKNNLNYLDLYIFEKNIIEFIEKQILFFINLLNHLKKIYESNFNPSYIYEFYSVITKNDNNLINISKDYGSCFNSIEVIKQNNNSNSSSKKSDYYTINTDSNTVRKKKISHKLLLPSLKNNFQSKKDDHKRYHSEGINTDNNKKNNNINNLNSNSNAVIRNSVIFSNKASKKQNNEFFNTPKIIEKNQINEKQENVEENKEKQKKKFYLGKMVKNKDSNMKNDKVKKLMKTPFGKKILEKVNNQKNKQKNTISENNNEVNNIIIEEKNNNVNKTEKRSDNNNEGNVIEKNKKTSLKYNTLDNDLNKRVKITSTLKGKNVDKKIKKYLYPKLELNDSSDYEEEKEDMKEKEKDKKEIGEDSKSEVFESDKSSSDVSNQIIKKSSKIINTKNSIESNNKNEENDHESKDPFTDLIYLKELLKNNDNERKKRIEDLFKNVPKKDKAKDKEKKEVDQQGNTGFTKNGFFIRRKKRYRTVIKSDFLI